MRRVLFITIATCGFITNTCSANTSKEDNGKTTSATTKVAFSYKNVRNNYNVDLALVEAASNEYLRKNYVYTYYEAVSIRKKLEAQLLQNPNSLGIRWALMRYYVSASNFVGGCSAKSVELSRTIYDIDPYLGCLAYEFVYNRLKKFDKAEAWYKRSILIAMKRGDVDLKDINCSRVAQTNVKVTGNFNNWTENSLYENYDGSYSRRVMLQKNTTAEYKVIVDERKVYSKQ